MADNIFRRILKSAIIDPVNGLIAQVFPGRMLSTSDFLVEVAKGNIAGHSIINKFGHNGSVVAPEDVWSGGGLYGFYPTTAQIMEAVSDDDEDGGAGTDTGALTMQVYGLDSNWDIQEETVVLNGVTPVALANTYIRMYRAVILTAGSNNTNIGNITVSIVTVGTVAAYIEAEDGQTQQIPYTIPNEKTGYFLKGYVGISKGGGATVHTAQFKWKARANNGINGAWATKGQIECITHGSSWWQYEYGGPAGPLPEKTDIRIECTEASTTLGVVGGYDILLVDDGY